MNPGEVSRSFHSVSSGLIHSIFQFLNTEILLPIGVYLPSKQSRFKWGSSLGSELATSEPSNSSPGEKFLSVLMCVCGALSCLKMTASSPNLSHSGRRYWSSVSTYFSEFCFPSKKTSSDEPREEMAAQHWATSEISVKCFLEPTDIVGHWHCQ